MTEAHGDEQAADIAHEFSRATGELLPLHGAEQIKTIGDALVLRVGAPAEAVKLALALTHDLLAECVNPTIRVGMHYGPAVHRAGDWLGATVNLAARVSGLAHGGEVLLTHATREHAREIKGFGSKRTVSTDFETSLSQYTRDGRKYYFCSLDCAAGFAGDPTLYADSDALRAAGS